MTPNGCLKYDRGVSLLKSRFSSTSFNQIKFKSIMEPKKVTIRPTMISGPDLMTGFRMVLCLGSGADGNVSLCLDDYGQSYAVKKVWSDAYQFKAIKKLEAVPGAEHYMVLPLMKEIRKTYGYIYSKVYEGDLYDRLRSKTQFTESQKLASLMTILKGIDWMHYRGICHNDIRLQNILYCSASNTIKFNDFGRTRFSEDYTEEDFKFLLDGEMWNLGRLIINLFGWEQLQHVQDIYIVNSLLDPIYIRFSWQFQQLGQIVAACFQFKSIREILAMEAVQKIAIYLNGYYPRVRNLVRARRRRNRGGLKIVKYRRR